MRWVSYFPEIHNVHLTKDVGLLPYYMQEVCGFDAALLGRFPEKEYPALQGEVHGLEIIQLEDLGSISFLEKAAMEYIKKEAKSIDVLQLSHLSRHTVLYGLLYKRHNPAGQLYLKLDAYNDDLRTRKKYARSRLKNAILNRLEKRFFKFLDLVSIENRPGYSIALETYPEWDGKLIYLPPGANDRFLQKHFPKPVPKENMIVSVGRIGSPEKNYELLIRALPLLKLDDWKMVIIGPVTKTFQEGWDEAKVKHPELAARIELLGSITDRKELYSYYQRSKVFFLPSRVESFGIAFAEALYFGNLLAGHSGMYAFGDLSENGAFGMYYDDNDPDSFADSLHRAMNFASEENDIAETIRNFAEREFHWTGLAGKLHSELTKRRKAN